MKKCPFCAEEIQDAAIVCKHCKRELATQQKEDTIPCPFCKAAVARDSKVCPACGDDISGVTGASMREAAAVSDKSALRKPIGRRQGLALLAVAVGFLMTLSTITAGFGIFAIWLGLAFAMTGGAIKRWGGGFILALILGAVGMSMGGSMSSTSTPTVTSTSASAPAAASVPSPPPQPTYQLALVSAKGYESEYGNYWYVEGQVKNISNQSLKNVTAVATWLDKDGGFIKADDAIIDYNPILAGQTSPFKTITSGNPAMSKYTLDFKTLMGGTLSVDDQRKK